MSVPYLGDYSVGQKVYIWHNSFDSNDPSASVTMTNYTDTDVHVYKDDSLTQRQNTAGMTLDIDVDTYVGVHKITIDTADNTVGDFWEAGHDYAAVIEGTTIDGATVNACIGTFSIANRRVAGQMCVSSIESLASQTSFTLTTGEASADNDAYNGCTIIVTDQVTQIQKAVGHISDYTGATRTIALYVAPLQTGYTMAVGDSVEIFATSAFANLNTIGQTLQTANDNGADINTLITNVGTPTDIDSKGASLAKNLGALADDNDGADFVASTDSLQKIRDDRTLAAADYTVVGDLGTVQSADNNTILSSINIANGAVESDLTYIHGSALTETAGQLAAAFKKLFDVATPLLVASDVMRGTDGANTTVPDAAGTAAVPGDAMNLAADAIKAVSYDESTAFPLKADDAGATQVARVGADGDTLETLSDQIDLQSTAVEMAKVPKSDSNVSWNATALAAIEGEANDALVAQKLDHLVAVADSDDVVDNSVMAKIASIGATADWSTFVNTTDSLQAIRDRGDAAWTTGAGGDATEAKQDSIIATLGTPTDIDSKGATISKNLGALADDNDGADFVASTDSLQKIRDRGDAAWITATSVTVSDKTGFSLSNAGIDAIWDQNSSLSISFEVLVERVYQLLNNEENITNATGAVALRNIGDSGDIATGSITDNDTTTSRAEFSWV